jgi:peptidyl-prolyl cis-trans isomerase A (cyclophilin A)
VLEMGSWDANVKGRPSHPGIPLEANNGLKNLRGTVSLARGDDPNSGEADFFINIDANGALDQGPDDHDNKTGYAVFGEVVDGMNVVDTISNVPVGDHGPMKGEAPVTPILISKVSILK